MSETIQVREGAYKQTADGGRLLGGVCQSCGMHFFPKPALCYDCLSNAINEVELSDHGTLFAWSTIHMPGAHFKPPYTVGYVDLPEKIRVFGPIIGDGMADLSAGLKMKIEVAPLWQEDGKDVIGHRFVLTEQGV